MWKNSAIVPVSSPAYGQLRGKHAMGDKVMTERDPGQINLRELVPGDRLRLSEDTVVQVINNPEDGMWIRARYVSVPSNPTIEGTEEQIFVGDVIERLQ